MKFYRTKHLCELWGVSRMTLHRWEKAGRLPPRIKLGPGVAGWTEKQIEEVLKQRAGEAEARLERSQAFGSGPQLGSGNGHGRQASLHGAAVNSQEGRRDA